MVTGLRTETEGAAAALATQARVATARTRLRSVHRDDVLVGLGAAASSLCLVWLIYAKLLGLVAIPGFVACWYLAFLAMYWLVVREMRGRLIATDAVMTVIITSAAVLMAVPLVMIISYVIYKGAGVITPHFFVQSAEFCGQLDPATCGGVGHAMIGTLEQVGIAVVIAVPLAVLCAVFLNEIGGPLKRPVQLVVDAMSGVPSIVAGLFVYATWVIGLGRGFSGVGAGLALSILMLPTVTRTAVEVLRLVPDGLREGSLALGGSEWRTVWSVVLPTARSGLITAVILGVARAVGEAAPLILTAFGSSVLNADPTQGAQEALPLYVFRYVRFNPGTGPYQRAWAAALVLTSLVLSLFILARLLERRLSVENRQRRDARRMRRAAERAAAGAGIRS